jgi:hypothetical protein
MLLSMAADPILYNKKNKAVEAGQLFLPTALDKFLCFGAGISVAIFLFGAGLGWKDIRVEHKMVNQIKSEAATQEKAESTD